MLCAEGLLVGRGGGVGVTDEHVEVVRGGGGDYLYAGKLGGRGFELYLEIGWCRAQEGKAFGVEGGL